MLALARATLDGTTLTVDLVASGLASGEVNPFHIHGLLDDSPERLAVAADGTDGDGRVESPEGPPALLLAASEHGGPEPRPARA